MTPWRPPPWQVARGPLGPRAAFRHGGRIRKSSFAAEKMHALLLRYPGATGLVVRKFSSSVPRSCGFMLRTAICGYAQFNSQKRMWQYPNRSILLYGVSPMRSNGKRSNRSGLSGVIHLDRRAKRSQPRITKFDDPTPGKAAGWCQVILTCNPESTKTTGSTRLLSNRNPRCAEIFWAIHTGDNPTLSPRYLATLDGKADGDRRTDTGSGGGSARGGWSGLRPSLHLIDPIRIPSGGGSNRSILDLQPASVLWLAQTQTGYPRIQADIQNWYVGFRSRYRDKEIRIKSKPQDRVARQ